MDVIYKPVFDLGVYAASQPHVLAGNGSDCTQTPEGLGATKFKRAASLPVGNSVSTRTIPYYCFDPSSTHEADAAVQTLLLLLKDREPSVRAKAYSTLPAIISGLDDDVNINCYHSCQLRKRLLEAIYDTDLLKKEPPVDALRYLECEVAVDALGHVLARDDDAYMRAEAARTLAEMGCKLALFPLRQVLDTEADPFVRAEVVTVLGEIASQSEIGVLGALLQTDPDEMVRMSAADALGRIGSQEAVPVLIRTLLEKESDFRTMEAAASALGEIGGEAAVDALIRVLRTKSDGFPRKAATDALGEIGDRSAVRPLLQILRDDSDTCIRAASAAALGRLGNREVVRELIGALKRPYDNGICKEHWTIVSVLENMLKGGQITELVVEAYNRSSGTERVFLAIALLRLNNTIGFDYLLHITTDNTLRWFGFGEFELVRIDKELASAAV